MKILLILVSSIMTFLNPNSQNIIMSLDEKTNGFGDIIIEIDNIQDLKGELYVGLYNSKRTFRKYKKVYKTAIVRVENDTHKVVIKDVPYNTYAIALFQDFNGNKRVDKNYLGAPKEPFGFSTNFKVKRRAPKFKQVTFDHGSEQTALAISLQKFRLY